MKYMLVDDLEWILWASSKRCELKALICEVISSEGWVAMVTARRKMSWSVAGVEIVIAE